MGFLIIIAAVICICILLSLVMQSKKKINLFAVFFCTIMIPGISFLILINKDRSLAVVFAIAVSAILVAISFIVSLVTSFVMQLLLLRKRNHDTDEMNRQLWLCDKLLIHMQAEGEDQKMALQECVNNMSVFLALRQKHFGIESVAEQNNLDSYLNQNDTVNIQAKLKEYKTWVARELYE